MAAVREFLVKEISAASAPVRVLDIACGPCREYESWPKTNSTVEVVAMDSDSKALEYVAQAVAPQLPESATLRGERYNALRTRSSETTVAKFGRFHILYSVGLCDYLPDEQLIEMLAAWRATLASGGVMYVAFKDAERYDKTPYQWHLDWFFFQRTQEDCMRRRDSIPQR
jgi:trans-aconitate methyltransferase